MSKMTLFTATKCIGCIIFLQLLFMHGSAIDLTLSKPSTTIKAQIGDIYNITCEAFKCQNPKFTWSSVVDQTLSGTVNTNGQISVLTMKISSESDGSYRCTVSCDKPPAEKSFRVITYSFPTKPVLDISSVTAGEVSRITCTIPDVYPSERFSVKILVGEKEVAEYEEMEMDTEPHVKNISMSYELSLTEEYDAAEIRCLAELVFEDDKIDPIEKQAMTRINLLYPPGEPHIIADSSTLVRAGGEVSLSCAFESRSPAKVHWVKLDNNEERVMASNEHGTLTIVQARPEDSGVYICYVQNDVGKSSTQVVITVEAVPEKPKLNIYPKTTAQAGQSVRIECVANGNVNVTLRKVLKDGDLPLLEKAGSYKINEVNPIDAGLYVCRAVNQIGSSDASELLKVEYPPMETLLSASAVEVNEGDTVTLSCSSKGMPEPSFSLYHLLPSGDGVLLSESPVVTLTNVTTGVYQCEARNSLGIDKNKLELSVKFKPRNTFLTITPSTMVREGDSISIGCTSEAYPAPKLVLKRRTEASLVLLEAESGLYNINHASEEHQGTYVCEASNVVGQELAEATLTVQVPPRDTHITIIPSSVLKEGSFVQIMCTSEATPDVTLSLKVRTELGMRELASEGGQYQIAHAGARHSGTYICESRNLAGEQIVETSLTIQVPPKNTLITITPSSVMNEGESGYVKCTSEAYPAPTLVLKRKTETELIELEHDGGKYKIPHAGIEHAGSYICVATNDAGWHKVMTKLTVQAPPKNTHISIIPSSMVTEGEDVQIQCISEAFPTPRFSLKKKTELGQIELLESEDGLFNITNAGLQDIGTYICESKNVAGQEAAEARLDVQIPSRITTVVTPSQNYGETVTTINYTHIMPFPERQQNPRFDYVPPAIIGSVVLISACAVGIIVHHLKKAKVQGSYSLVKALRSKV